MTFTLSVLSLILPLSAQTVGGGWEPTHEFYGAKQNDKIANALSNVGDVDGDGVDDIIMGCPTADPSNRVDAGYVVVFSGATGSELLYLAGHKAGDQFGKSVAPAGDMNLDGHTDYLIGAPFARQTNGDISGRAYAYSGADGQLLATYESTSVGGEFGACVTSIGDVDGDGIPDVLVGEPKGGTNPMTTPGSFSVFSGLSNTLLAQADGITTNAWAGASAAGLGDINGDGVPDYAVGNPKAKSGGRPDGAVVVYSGHDHSALITHTPGLSEGHFGAAICNAGDVDKDGVNDYLVGSPNYYLGAVLLYSGATQTEYTRIYGTINGAHFGQSVAPAGDFDDDGFIDFLVGISHADPKGVTDAGAVHVYSSQSIIRLWNYQGKELEANLGSSVAKITDSAGAAQFVMASKNADHGGASDVGKVEVVGFNPYLTATAESISVSAGGLVSFDLNFPASAAGYEYKLLASQSGNGPYNHGVDIPLTYDATFQFTWDGNQPGAGNGGHFGTLDANGDGSALILIHPESYSYLVGISLQIAAVAMPMAGLPEFSSVAVPFDVIP